MKISEEEQLQLINDKITAEIRLNRAIKVELQRMGKKSDKTFVILQGDNTKYNRNFEFVDNLIEDYENIKREYNTGKDKKVNIGHLSAVLKSLEVEEKYLHDKFFKAKAHCTIAFFAYMNAKNLLADDKRLMKPKKISWSMGLMIFVVLLLSFLLGFIN